MEVEDSDSSSDEEYPTFNSSEAYRRKAMPWLYPDFKDRRDEDKKEIKFILKKHLVYPDSTMTDQKIQLPEMEPEIFAKPQKILICAPSNAAIDQIVRLIMNNGLFDENGGRFNPTLVRIGPNFHQDLKSVSLQNMVAAELQSNSQTQSKAALMKDIIKRTKLICSTLSVTGSNMLTKSDLIFDTVIVDEAAQAVELSTLIPLKFKCKRLILIGDPNQLPATIFSKKCGRMNYDRSLFQRLMMNGYPVKMLKEQYRMHPFISKIISETFYKSEVQNYDKIMDLVGKQKMYSNKKFEPVVVYNVKGVETFVNNSYVNTKECIAVIQLIEDLHANYPEIDLKKVGVITAYSGQVRTMRKALKSLGKTYSGVEVHTVDGFQGREKDVILFSCVRSHTPEGEPESGTIGFLNDRRRMNVSLSRARLCLIVVGNIKKLYKSTKWRRLVDYAYGLSNLYNFDDVIVDKEDIAETGVAPGKKLPSDINGLRIYDLTEHI